MDVRTPDEWRSGIIPGARLIEHGSKDFATKLAELDKDAPVFVYCAAGGRSYRTAKYLTGQGFTQVYDLVGGIEAWKESGRSVVDPGKASKE